MDFVNDHAELKNNMKVLTYIKGSFVLVMTLLHFNEVYKIISGSSAFSLKLNSIKKQIETVNKESYQTNKMPYPEIKEQLKRGKIQKINICRYCLRKPGDHQRCMNVIKMYENSI